MKTKKILAIAISCLLLIGVVAGITASAADAPAVAVSEVNLSYEGAIRMLYTLNTENLAAGQTVKAVFSTDADVAVADGKFVATDYPCVSDAFVMENGNTAVYSMGIAPTAMTEIIYAIPVVVDASGSVAAVGAKVGFSIYDYCMTRLSGEYTSEQNLLYLATLNLGGSIQAGQKKLYDKDPTNGYADQYYALSVKNGDGSTSIYKFAEPTEYQLVAPRSMNGKLFDHFEDKAGKVYENANFNKLTVSLDKPGYIYVKAVYGDVDAVSATIPAGHSSTLANPDSTPATVMGGSDYYVESGVTLSEGATATLAFNPDVASVTLTENAGKITVTDGVSTFEMDNGAILRVEYTVINTIKKTGTLFYYVDGEYVAKSDVTSTANATFTGVTATAAAGDFTVDGVALGYKAGNATWKDGSGAVVTAEFDGTDKYFVYDKELDTTPAGHFSFAAEDGSLLNYAVFEAEMKLTDNFYSSSWRNALDVYTRRTDGGGEISYTRFIIQKSTVSIGGVVTTLDTPIADDGWFNLRIEIASGSAVPKENQRVAIYINDQLVYETTSLLNDGDERVGRILFIPSDSAAGSISIKNAKLYDATPAE